MTFLTDPFFQALGWTLAHFLWQGTAVAFLLAAVNAALGRGSANARYLASCAALLLMLALPVVTLWMILSQPDPTTKNINVISATTTEASSVEPIEHKSAARPPQPSHESELQAETSVSVSDATTPTRWIFFTYRELSPALPWFTSLWLAGVLLLSLRMLGGWLYTWRLLSRRTSPLAESWQQRLTLLREELRVSRPVRLVQSALVQVPAAIGWLRPMILIPTSALMGLTPRQLEAIIAHELAHIRRYDYLINLIQSAVEILLFYHPAVWWVSRQARTEREHCCDDLAVKVCGDALTYARALSEIEELRSASPQIVMAANGGVLLARIQRLLGVAPRSPYEPAPWMGATLAFALLLILAAGSRGDLFSTVARPSSTVDERVTVADSTSDVEESQHRASSQIESDSLERSESILQIRQADESDELPVENQTFSDDEESENYQSSETSSQSGSYIEELAALGYTALTVDQLVALKNNGVTPSFIRDLRSAGYNDLKIEELIRLARHGVTAKYAAAMKEAGLENLTVNALIRMRSHGVSPEFVKALREAGFKEIDSNKIVRAASHGLTLEYIKEMRAEGYASISLDELIRARNHAVDPEFIKGIRDQGFDTLNFDQIIRIRDSGVGPDYIRELRSLGFARIGINEIIRAANHAVSVQYIREMRNVGYTDISLDQVIRLRNNAVSPEYIKALKESGYDRLTVEQVIRLRNQGITSEFIKKVKAQGIQNLSVDQLIRLRNAGIFN